MVITPENRRSYIEYRNGKRRFSLRTTFSISDIRYPILGAAGQSLTEFIVVTAVLTALGILIMDLMTGPNRTNGAIQNVSTHATTAVVNDKD